MISGVIHRTAKERLNKSPGMLLKASWNFDHGDRKDKLSHQNALRMHPVRVGMYTDHCANCWSKLGEFQMAITINWGIVDVDVHRIDKELLFIPKLDYFKISRLKSHWTTFTLPVHLLHQQYSNCTLSSSNLFACPDVCPSQCQTYNTIQTFFSRFWRQN